MEEARFLAAADTDGDGVISDAELTAARAASQRARAAAAAPGASPGPAGAGVKGQVFAREQAEVKEDASRSGGRAKRAALVVPRLTTLASWG